MKIPDFSRKENLTKKYDCIIIEPDTIVQNYEDLLVETELIVFRRCHT